MRLIIGLVLTAGIIWLLGYLSEVLLPFFVGCFIAYMLQPLVELNRRWIRLDGRIVAVIVTLLEVTVVIGGVIYMFLPSVVSEVNMMADIVKDLSSGRKPMPESYRRMTDILSRYFEPDNFEELFSLQHMDTLIRRGSSLVAADARVYTLHTHRLSSDHEGVQADNPRALPQSGDECGEGCRVEYEPLFPRAGCRGPVCGGVLLCGVLYSRHSAGYSVGVACGCAVYDTLFSVCHAGACGCGVFHILAWRDGGVSARVWQVLSGVCSEPERV